MSFIQYLKDTKAELSHVSWPTRKQTLVYTLLVITLSAFVAVYLGVFDYVLEQILAKLLLR